MIRRVSRRWFSSLLRGMDAEFVVDPNYTKAFLMTFKSFTTLDELFDLLVQRFKIQPPRDLAPLELRQWISKKKNIVQFRHVYLCFFSRFSSF